MSDPLNDPRFPDRPTHPDFWRVSDVLLKLDGDATEGGRSTPEILAGLVDTASLTYMAEQKAIQARQIIARRDPRTRRAMEDPAVAAAMAAMWMNAFAAGALFQREGGHRDS